MSKLNTPSFLGRGWSFPPSFSQNGAIIEMVADEVDISQSLKLLLSTHTGERLMHSKFGCDIRRFQFQEISLALISSMQDVIRDAILNYEPRVKLEKLEITESKQQLGMLLINIDYLIRITNSRSNLVYPFYLHEADLNIRE